MTGKILIQGTLELISPIRIGSGNNENTNCDVLLDNDKHPYIPATSFAGILKKETAFIMGVGNTELLEFEKFWGANSLNQSRILIDDLVVKNESNASIVIRDGIRIDNTTGMVEKNAKYDAEVVEPGALFAMNIEMEIRDIDVNIAKKICGTIVVLLTKGIALGAKTSTGLGKIKLKEKVQFKELNFSKREHVVAWLKKDFDKGDDIDLNEFYPKVDNDFIIEAIFEIKNSLIVRSYANAAKAPDSVHMKSNGKNILPGTSVKGALRSRSEKILNTIWADSKEVRQMLDTLFGGFETEGKGKKKQDGYEVASRLCVDEIEITDTAEELQTRIKIDRFTGGTIESALFDNVPLFPIKDKEHIKHFRIKIENPQKSEKGLALLLLKDLWTGTLAIGGEKNVGRGVLKGKYAFISYNHDGKPFEIKFSSVDEIPKEAIEKFDVWITALSENKDKAFQEGRLFNH